MGNKSPVKANQLIESVERFKVALLNLCTGKGSDYTDDEYADVRKTLVRHPEIAGSCPEWLRRGSTLTEVQSRIRQEAGPESGQWERRRAIISRDLDAIIDILEGSGSEAVAALERLERLGAGGFGEVYRCWHKFANCHFALKVLNPSAFGEEKERAVARFFQEAQILFRLRHDNIVRVFDVGLMQGRPFMRMELVVGATLGREGSLSVDSARHAICSVAGALAHAHAIGVVHRDLKPSNVMIEEVTSRPVLLDFGLGAFVQQEITSRLTRTGEAPAGGSYTAPELLMDPRILETSCDIYSLGVLWYQALTGSLPPRRLLEPRLRQLDGLSNSDIDLIVGCLDDDPQGRPTAADLANTLSD